MSEEVIEERGTGNAELAAVCIAGSSLAEMRNLPEMQNARRMGGRFSGY